VRPRPANPSRLVFKPPPRLLLPTLDAPRGFSPNPLPTAQSRRGGAREEGKEEREPGGRRRA
jgi:hypothetical protein